MKCINQNMTISLTDDDHISKPIGKIHRNVKTYKLIDRDGFDWGAVELCEKCKDRHVESGWKCILIENK